MYLKVEAKILKTATKKAMRAIAKHSATIEVFKCFKIEANTKNMIRVTSGNGALFFAEQMEAEVFEEGGVLVPAQLFSEVVNKYDGKIEIKTTNDKLSIKSSNSKISLITKDVADFPSVASVQENMHRFVINRELFLNMVDKVSFAASTDLTKGSITGVLISLKDGTITMAAVDGYRMAVYSDAVDSKLTTRVVVPVKELIETQRILLRSKETELDVNLDERNAYFSTENVQIVVSLLNGDFIDYQNLFPKKHNTIVVVNKESLYRAIDRSTLIAGVFKHNLVKLTFGETGIRVESESDEGSISESIPADITGDDVVIGFNAKYLMDALRGMSGDEITLKLQSAITPMVLIEGRYDQLVLPVRLSTQ